jgi:hypothetical protein
MQGDGLLIRLRRAAHLGPHLVAICGDLVELRGELRRLCLQVGFGLGLGLGLGLG